MATRAILLLLLSGMLVLAQTATPPYFLEREPVDGGAELITLFGRVPGTGSEPASTQAAGVPLLTVLRDSLGDADSNNDRLRYVWILTSTHPTPLQRAASALSFFWFRAGHTGHANRVPTPALDLGSPSRAVWTNLLGNGLQATQFDGLGMAVRASTRSYRGNFSDYRKVQLFGALSALNGLEQERAGDAWLSDAERRQLYSRLSLSDRTLGGLVREQNLPRFYDRETARIQEMRGHNWELLRQRAELCGLYFEPLGLPGDTPFAALLWVAQEDLKQGVNHSFDGQFLNISDPWTDERLQHWTGYTEPRYLDADNRLVTSDASGARPVEMIPLAFYSLDHPRTPLLLADFRDQLKPKRRELFLHGSTVLVSGVLGVSRFGNWPYFASESVWTFVRRRHGAAVNRSARLRAYSEARAFLAVDTGLPRQLKSELVSRLDHLALNPLENRVAAEGKLAREQYDALLRYARAPEGLLAKIEQDRRKELASYEQSRIRRMFAAFGRVFTGGQAARPQDPVVIAKIGAYRRMSHHQRYLEQLLASSPRPEVVGDPDEIRRSIESLSVEPVASTRAPQLIAEVFTRSADPDLRVACLRALHRFNVEQASNELRRLALDPETGDGWRELCLLYLRGGSEPALAVGSGGQ